MASQTRHDQSRIHYFPIQAGPLPWSQWVFPVGQAPLPLPESVSQLRRPDDSVCILRVGVPPTSSLTLPWGYNSVF